MKQERRKYTRHEIGNALSVHPEGLYQIVDISKGGFRFKCPPDIAIPETWITDIINSVIPLEGFTARKVWISLYENGRFNRPSLLFVGARFNKLRKEQKNKLIELIDSI